MKKYLILLIIITSFFEADSQLIRPNPTTNFQQFGSPVTLTRINGLLYPAVGYAPALYADTAAMNATYLKNVPLAEASTIDGKTWRRNYACTKWEEFAIGSGSTPTLTSTQIAYGDGSNLMTSSNNLIYNGTNFGLNANIVFNASASSVDRRIYPADQVVLNADGHNLLLNGGNVTNGIGIGGQIALESGSSTNGIGGILSLQGGDGAITSGNAAGGSVNIDGGQGGGTGAGGQIIITGGNGGDNGVGADVIINGGPGGNNNQNGGDVVLRGGLETGTGVEGNIRITKGDLIADSSISASNISTTTLSASGAVQFSGISAGTGRVLTSDAAGNATWATSASALTVPISSLTAATGANSINNGAFTQNWSWNTITSGALGLYTTSSTTSTNNSYMLQVGRTGTHAASSILTYGIQISNGHAGTSSENVGIQSNASNGETNIGGRFTALSGTNNYAIIVPASSGSVGIGTSTPAKIFHTVGTVRHASLGTASIDTTTNKPLGINSSGDVIPMTYWPGGGGGSPAGNYGNLQINRNGSFATPASDSLDFESATGLSVKGNISSTNKIAQAGADGDITSWMNSNSGNLASTINSNPGMLVYNGGAGSLYGYYLGYLSSGYGLASITGNATSFFWVRGGGNQQSDASRAMTLNSSDQLSIGGGAYLGSATTAPTAILHIKAGTATANTAPLKLTTGASLTTAEAGALEYTTPQLFFTNGAAVRQELFQGQQSRVSTQFDKTSNTTLADITGLTATLAAGKTYRFEAILSATSNIAGGVKYAIAGTCTATNIIYEEVTTDGGVLKSSNRASALGTAVTITTTTTNPYTRITGTITVNAAGTLTVQMAQNASNGTASSVLVGSTFVVTEML